MKKEIHRSYDEYGPIQVFDDGQKRFLAFGNDDQQSCQLIHEPYVLQHEYTRAILLVLLMAKQSPLNITVIGIGGGTLISTFMHLLPDAKLVGVELRPQVLKIAHKYFQLEKSPRFTTHISDGLEYLKNSNSLQAPNTQVTNAKTDILIADMYSEAGLDERQLTETFIQHAASRINQGGWLVLNYWLDHKMEPELADILYEYFDQVYMCESGGGNWVIFAGKVDISKTIIDDSLLKPLSKQAGFSLGYYLDRLRVLA